MAHLEKGWRLSVMINDEAPLNSLEYRKRYLLLRRRGRGMVGRFYKTKELADQRAAELSIKCGFPISAHYGMTLTGLF